MPKQERYADWNPNRLRQEARRIHFAPELALPSADLGTQRWLRDCRQRALLRADRLLMLAYARERRAAQILALSRDFSACHECGSLSNDDGPNEYVGCDVSKHEFRCLDCGAFWVVEFHAAKRWNRALELSDCTI